MAWLIDYNIKIFSFTWQSRAVCQDERRAMTQISMDRNGPCMSRGSIILWIRKEYIYAYVYIITHHIVDHSSYCKAISVPCAMCAVVGIPCIQHNYRH